MIGSNKNYSKAKKRVDWISKLLDSKFFNSCLQHEDLRKNEINFYCIDCKVGFCKHCRVHYFHEWFQICKYVYHNVVRIQDIQKHLDCSKIQTYKINSEKAVHLNPRPQPKDAKPSTKAKCAASCQGCRRYIQDHPNLFCSIACKISYDSSKYKEENGNTCMTSTVPDPQDNEDMILKENYNLEETKPKPKPSEIESSSTLSLADSIEEFHASTSPTLKARKQLHRRKGVPHRSPFF